MKLSKILFATFIALTAANAWADLTMPDSTREVCTPSATDSSITFCRMASDVCSPIIHFKKPDNWVNAYIVIGGYTKAMPQPDENGWITVSFDDANAVGPNSDQYFFINSTMDNTCYYSKCITSKGVNVNPMNPREEGFTCKMFGNKKGSEIWLMENPDPKKSGEVYVSTKKPDIKDFYVFVPNNNRWKGAMPIINEDGKEKTMDLDPDNCGWYFRRYIDEQVPNNVVIRTDDDETMERAIGMNGTWSENAAEPIPLKALFDIYSTEANYNNALYFIADEEQANMYPATNKGWFTTPPDIIGTCGYELAALIYDTDASLHGAFSCAPDWNPGQSADQARSSACYYATAKFPVVKSATSPMPCVGVTPGMVESTLNPKTKKMKLTAKGQTCFGEFADEAFAAMFNYTPGVNEEYCFNMPFIQTSDGKFEFESNAYQSPGAPVPGGFYPAEQAPADAMMLSERLPAAESKRKAEGPTFFCSDGNNTSSKTPLGLRTIDETEGVPKSDLICNGPGWDGGVDCEGYFASGDEFTLDGSYSADIALEISKKLNVTWAGDGWGWSCDFMNAPEGWPRYKEGTETIIATTNTSGSHRWVSGKGDSDILTTAGRNQHFCFESHANFRYKKGLRFSFRGDDDIWVYIDNKLAVDIGGTHLAAPGYVDLDKFMPKGVVGKYYDIDIFFCDRRTTMSNVHIKTNMFIEQASGISAENKHDQKGNSSYNLCYKKISGGSCADAVSAFNPDDVEIDDNGCVNIKDMVSYILTTDKTGQDPTKTIISNDDFTTNPKQFGGSIDVSNTSSPIINEEKLKDYLPSGMYYLVITIGADTKAIPITIKSNISIADRDFVTLDQKGKVKSTNKFSAKAMASISTENGVPDIQQTIPLYISAFDDPCVSNIDCNDPLEIQPTAGASYALEVSNSKAVLYEMNDGELSRINPATMRTIGESGIDTIYVTIPMEEMESAEEKISINVKGHTRKANVEIFVPKFAFVDSDTTYNIVTEDKDSKTRSLGSTYDFYLIALDNSNVPCGKSCNFPISKGSATSAGISIVAGNKIVNGRATITIQSSKAYEKCADSTCNGAASLHVIGPNPVLMQATYGNLQFQEPPVAAPIFADIFDANGKKPSKDTKIPDPYFSMDQKYLDGIGDSVVVYYHRNFHKDSLPEKIAVFWENNKDSVVFDKATVKKGAVCGSSANLDKSHCLNRISLSGKKFSKNVKTSGKGKIKSWTTYTARGKSVTTAFESVLYDRIAPIIISAKAVSDKKSKTTTLKIEFSEQIQKTKKADSHGDKVFSFYINSTKKAQFVKGIAPASGKSLDQQSDSIVTFAYSQSSTYPQVGDYINFRSVNGDGLVGDLSDYASAPGGDTLRPSSDSKQQWNFSLGYDTETHLPAPWVLITEGVAESKDNGKEESKENSKDKDNGKDKDNDKDSPEKVYAKPSFRLKMTAPFEFAIVLDESLPSLAKKYTVMDMKGQVVSTGTLDNKDTRVKVQTNGSYVVKVGLIYKRVNVR